MGGRGRRVCGGCCVQLVGVRGVPRVFKAFKSCFCRVCRYCYMILRLYRSFRAVNHVLDSSWWSVVFFRFSCSYRYLFSRLCALDLGHHLQHLVLGVARVRGLDVHHAEEALLEEGNRARLGSEPGVGDDLPRGSAWWDGGEAATRQWRLRRAGGGAGGGCRW